MATRVNSSAWFVNPWHAITSRPSLSRPRLQFRHTLFSSSSSSSSASSATRGAVCCPGSSNDASETDPFVLTTPLYYVNAPPHMGSAYTTIAADAIARFQRLLGKKVIFITGTEEHGEKIATAASARGSSPSEHCDVISQALSPSEHCDVISQAYKACEIRLTTRV